MRKILLAVMVLLFTAGIGFCQEEPFQVIVRTDKDVYDVGEVVKVTLTNNLDGKIFSIDSPHAVVNIERKSSEGNWEKFLAWDTNSTKGRLPRRIRPGESVSYEWKLIIMRTDGSIKECQAGPGMYRMLIEYETRKVDSAYKDGKAFEVYTNEFRIKQKEQLTSKEIYKDELILPTVKTDKEVYGAGEAVKITLTNNLCRSIFSHNSIHSIVNIERKSSEGSWEKFFPWRAGLMFKIGHPGEISPGESILYEWEPILYTDDINRDIEGIQVDSGIFRVLVRYNISQERTGNPLKIFKVYTNEFRIK